MRRAPSHGFLIKVGEAGMQVYRLHESKDLLGSCVAQNVSAECAIHCPQF